MNFDEYYEAKKLLTTKKQLSLLEYVEAVIATEGHGWCMDVKSERNQMAKLLVKAANDFSLKTK